MTKRLRGLLKSRRTRGSAGLIAAAALMFVALPAFAADTGSAQLGPIMNAIVWLFSFFVYAGGMALNAAAYYSIVKMGAFVGSQSALQIAWATFRDIGNIAILFGFIAMGIQTILDTDSHGTRKKIVMLVIVAVAINFSSLAARAVVDVGNITALQFYKAFNGNTLPNGTTFSDNGISQKFMEVVRLQTVLNTTGADGSASQTPGIIDSATIGFLAVVLFVIVAFVFFSLAFLFIARLVILTFLITISPLAFAAMVVPGFGEQTKKWWSALLNNTFVAPLVMLMLLVSTKLLESNAFQTALGNNQGAQLSAVAGAGWVNMLLTFGIATGFFVASLLIAKQLSAFGANGAINLGRKVVSYPFAFAHRTVTAPVAGSLARRYDAFAGRNPRIGGALRFVGLDNTIHSGLTAAKNAKIGGFESAEERKKRLEARRSESSHAATAAKNKADLEKAIEAADDKAIARILQGSSLHDIEEAIKTGSQDEVDAMARNLSPEKFEDAMKSKEITEDKKHHMQAARFSRIDATNVKNQTTKDLEMLAKYDAPRFEELIGQVDADGRSIFKEDQLETLGKSNALTASQRTAAKDAGIVRRVENLVRDGDFTGAGAYADMMNAGQKPKLAKAALLSPEVIDTFDQNDLAGIIEEKKLEPAERRSVVARLKAAHTASVARRAAGAPTTPDDERLDEIDENFRKNPYAAGQWGW